MAGIYLARHGSHPLVDKVLLGRSDMAGLSEKGFSQARAMAASLESADIVHVQSSPRQRCRQTAMVLATALGVPMSVEPALDEVNFGRWSGRSFAELDGDMRWRRWNDQRSAVRPPGGEMAAEAQARILEHVRQTVRWFPGQAVLMVTHAELIRAVLLSRMDLGLDAWAMVPVAPGSVVRIEPEPERMAS
jgi:broad specificity phosphatase PhoE